VKDKQHKRRTLRMLPVYLEPGLRAELEWLAKRKDWSLTKTVRHAVEEMISREKVAT
jgi:hypothetical protein